MLLHESFRLPRIATATGATHGGRAVFAGAQAMVCGFGKGYSMGKFRWVEQMFDFKNQFGVAAGVIGGMKKSVYNGTDYATITLSTQHTLAARTASGR